MRFAFQIWLLCFLGAFYDGLSQQPLRAGWYRGVLTRADQQQVVFNFELQLEKQQPVLYIKNAEERLRVDDLRFQGDSLFISMPFFESDFRVRVHANGSWTGKWIRGISTGFESMPFEAAFNQSERIVSHAAPSGDISGKWQVTILRANGTPRPAIASFRQRGNYLEGTFLTPTGDYRFLEGVVSGDTMRLSCFDGSHAYLFSALYKDQQITHGMFYSGVSGLEKWSAQRNDAAALPDTIPVIAMKPGQEKIAFAYPDLDGRMIALNDERFRNKVVLVQIMGSWCPNCMDETAFLSKFYKENSAKGVEVLALAYELSTDAQRSRNSLLKFQQRFQVAYPMLNTGITVTDELRTEKTLPQLTGIRAFPTLIFIDKKGNVRKLHQGFYGPGAPEQYEAFKTDFYRTVLALLSE